MPSKDPKKKECPRHRLCADKKITLVALHSSDRSVIMKVELNHCVIIANEQTKGGFKTQSGLLRLCAANKRKHPAEESSANGVFLLKTNVISVVNILLKIRYNPTLVNIILLAGISDFSYLNHY